MRGGAGGAASGGTVGAQRDSTLMGLPQSAIAITIDGVNIQDQFLKYPGEAYAPIYVKLAYTPT